MINVTRGASVAFFGITFLDANKNLTVPDAAKLRISYPKKGALKCEDISLTKNGSAFEGTWDSSVSDDGIAYWYVESVTPQVSAAQGQFRIVANPANMGCQTC